MMTQLLSILNIDKKYIRISYQELLNLILLIHFSNQTALNSFFQLPEFLDSRKDAAMRRHSGSPCQAFAHCKGFAPAASRRTCTYVSECISGLSLSRPVVIIGLLGSYPNNDLITRSPILHRLAALGMSAFQPLLPMGYYAQFPEVISQYRAC